MKNIVSILFILVSTIYPIVSNAAANSALIYQEQFQKCDTSANTAQEKAVSTVQIVQIIDEQKKCYTTVANEIIDAEYAKSQQQTKSEFDNFIYAATKVARIMQDTDTCVPDCGTIAGINAATAELELIKTYTQQLLYAISQKD